MCVGFNSCGMLAQQLLLSGQGAGSVVVAHGLSCSVACGIFPDQGLNPCPLHWQADSFFLTFLKLIYLFIFGCIGFLLLRMGFLQLWRLGATLHCSAWASHCGGFSCCGALALGSRASVVVAHRLSSCGARAQLLCGMWDLPGPGLGTMSPAFAGRFLTTAPPGKSSTNYFTSLELKNSFNYY